MLFWRNFKKKSNFGEETAAKYLRKKGYKIIETNYRLKFGEIDIIAEKDGVIAIVEVKQRGENAMYSPREAVNFSKQTKIRRTAEYYMMKNGLTNRFFRFDVIEVVGEKNPQINHIENAFK